VATLVAASVALPGASSASAAEPRTVVPGDTLSEIAEQVGISQRELAAQNGLDPDGLLLAGTVLELSDGSGGDTSSGDSGEASGPDAAGEQVSSDEIIQLAEEHGVPGSLAAAIAWQESGFSNAAVSGAGARGVMQIIPDTWDFVQNSLASGPLDASSARDNVHAGVMFLAYLLGETGGDPELAAAAYYQGLGSVRSQGLLPETERYVANVTALRSRFGGP
jgi:soluble lytic murein transglycosylase-like protein